MDLEQIANVILAKLSERSDFDHLIGSLDAETRAGVKNDIADVLEECL